MYDEVSMGADKPKKSPLNDEIDEKIRDLYKETLDEGVPDRFAKLLDELRKKEQGK